VSPVEGAPGYANAEILAATLRGWAEALRRCGEGRDLFGDERRFLDAAADLANAAAWVERTVDNDRAGLAAQLRAMRDRQAAEWGELGDQLPDVRQARQLYLWGLAAAAELVETGVPVLRGER
jgi:hypothetical protein